MGAREPRKLGRWNRLPKKLEINSETRMKFKVGDLVRLDLGKTALVEVAVVEVRGDVLGFIQGVGAQTALVKWVNGRGGYYKFAELEKIAPREENKNEKL